MAMPDEDRPPRSNKLTSISSSSTNSTSQKSSAETLPPGILGSINSLQRRESNNSTSHIDRVYSRTYPDDNAVYQSDSADFSGDGDFFKPVEEEENELVTKQDTDVEKGQQPILGIAKLKSSRSNRSRHDVKLVCITNSLLLT